MANAQSGLFSTIGGAITTARNFFFNAVFVFIIVALSVALLSTCSGVTVPENGALVINPRGVIVEERSVPDPLQGLLSSAGRNAEVTLDTLLASIEHAASDDDIKMIVLNLDELLSATPAQAHRISASLEEFRQSGKRVVAYGNYYTQEQYHIASGADAIYMHPMGQVVLQGFGGYNFYIKDLLQQYDVNVHVFRVGTYKAAIEPLTRNDMSEEARLADEALYQNLWLQMLQRIADNRQLQTEELQAYAEDLPALLTRTRGDLARVALEHHLVDELLSPDQARVRFADDVGLDSSTGDINGIDYLSYAAARDLETQPLVSADQIGVVVAQGVIVGAGRGPNVVGAEEFIGLIRQARHNPDIRALVLRVDSPGGSQFASELIRQELELVQLAGKPVVASFGSAAASGGYWIASTADYIVAEAASITGSIGIFSFITTFEDTLEKVGVHTDGVGTTPLAGLSTFTGINDSMAQIQQSRVENGYEQFVNLVARGRNKPVNEIEEIAEGRVWSGDVALDLGLVDDLGGLRTAIDKAGELAGLETWEVTRLRLPLDPRAAILAELMGSDTQVARNLLSRFQHLFNLASQLDDPFHTYALCARCSPRLMTLF